MVEAHKFIREQTIVGIDDVLVGGFGDGVQESLVQGGVCGFLVIEIIARIVVLAEIVFAFCRHVRPFDRLRERFRHGNTLCLPKGSMRLGVPNVSPYFLYRLVFIQIAIIHNGFAQLVIGERTTRARHGVLTFAIAIYDAAHTLGGDAFGIVFHLHQNELTVAAVLLVEVQNGMGGGARASKTIEDDGGFVCCTN